MVCEECGSADEIHEHTGYWCAWGNNAFDFNWSKYDDPMFLCEECEGNEWQLCYDCGATIEANFCSPYYMGLPEDYDGVLCPDCAQKWLAEKEKEKKLVRIKGRKARKKKRGY